MIDLLKRIANYFANEYDGDDKTAPKMELSVDELRYIASMNVDRCRLLKKANSAMDTLDKIKEIIREEEHYPVSNSLSDPHPNEQDYNKAHADKFNRIWKVISDADN